MKKKIFFISLGVFALFDSTTALSHWESLSVALMVFFFLEFLHDLGRRIVILEVTILIALFTWLVMPVIFYHVYTRQNPLAKLWYRYMLVDSDAYFSFLVPATLLLIFGLRYPLVKLKYAANPRIYMDNVREQLAQKPNLGLILIAVGVVSGLLNSFVPSSIGQIFYFIAHLTYVGVFYVLYSPNKRKRLVLLLVFILMLGQSIITGMFGEFIFLLILSSILMMLGTKYTYRRKISVAVFGLFFLVLIQSVKSDYRLYSWVKGNGADPYYFVQLIGERLVDPAPALNDRKLFTFSVRMNQGWLIAMTMYKVPEKLPFANGETIWQSVAASFVPRFLWPDKPESGGRANILRFWGTKIETYSINIGPIGEAYGNFGLWGGIIYMFFYGLFFNFILSRIMKMSEARPTLILWLPYLFLYAVNVETDLVTTMNSVVKGVFFVWIVYKVFKSFFSIEL